MIKLIFIFLTLLLAVLDIILIRIIFKSYPKEKEPFLSMGDSLFLILEELCNTPNRNLYSFKALIKTLNKGKKVDSPLYGIGDNELNMLVKEGYIHYWDTQQEKKSLN